MAQAQPTSPGNFVQRLKTILYAQVTMMVIVNAVAYLRRPTSGDPEFSNALLYALAFLCMTMIGASSFIFKSVVARAAAENNLSIKLSKYMAASLARMACLEVLGLFAAVIIFLTGNLVAFAGTALALMLFTLYQPSRERVIADLRLSTDEAAQLD